MTDTRHLSREFLTGFIELYKQNPCLWKIKHKDYSNKSMRNAAYDVLVSYSKGLYPNANREFVTKKIQSLRGSFRKELQKVRNSLKSNADTSDIYNPSLWYFNLLKFTTNQEEAIEIESTSNLDDENREYPVNNDETEESENEEQIIFPTEHKKRKIAAFSSSSSSTLKPKRRKNGVRKTKFIESCLKALNRTSEISEYEAVGIYVAKKLERMEPTQALYAEYLINTVLKKGLLKTLTESTEIRN